jgi:hypothetical protein
VEALDRQAVADKSVARDAAGEQVSEQAH